MTTPSIGKVANPALPKELADLAGMLDPLTYSLPGGFIAALPGGALEPASASPIQLLTDKASAGAPDQWNLVKLFGSAEMLHKMLPKYNGAGVHVGVYDDGIDKSVAALMTHYDASRELVINGVRADPGVLGGPVDGAHGTAVNGIIAADPTKTGGQVTGIAYGCSITDFNITTPLAAYNFPLQIYNTYRFDIVKIGSISTVGGFTWDISNSSFGNIIKYAIDISDTIGRHGLGTVIIKDIGNFVVTNGRDLGPDTINSDRHVIVVGAVSGEGTVSGYSLPGKSLLTSAPSGGAALPITTTDRPGSLGYSDGDFTDWLDNTSCASAEVSAVAADMLGANGKLGARDVQAILALASHDNETSQFTTAATGNMHYGWTLNRAASAFNGGGYHYSNDEGFGELNAHDAIREAMVWTYMNSTAQTYGNEGVLSATVAGQHIPTTEAGSKFTFTMNGAEIVEHADLTLNITSAHLDHLQVVLTSPAGTQSIVLDALDTATWSNFNLDPHGISVPLGSRAFLGETAQGIWTAQVIDKVSGDGVVVNSAELDLYGSVPSASHVFHYTDEAAKMDAFDLSRITLHDPAGVGSWIDTAMMTGNEVIDLRTGHSSTENGKAFLTIGADTVINKITLGDGKCGVICNDNGDTVVAGGGTSMVSGGKGNDTFIAGSGVEAVAGGGGADTFVFDHVGFGSMTITDFARGVDHLDLRAFGTNFGLLRIADTGATITISNIDAVGDTIMLTNTHHQHLSASDFLFA